MEVAVPLGFAMRWLASLTARGGVYYPYSDTNPVSHFVRPPAAARAFVRACAPVHRAASPPEAGLGRRDILIEFLFLCSVHILGKQETNLCLFSRPPPPSSPTGGSRVVSITGILLIPHVFATRSILMICVVHPCAIVVDVFWPGRRCRTLTIFQNDTCASKKPSVFHGQKPFSQTIRAVPRRRYNETAGASCIAEATIFSPHANATIRENSLRRNNVSAAASMEWMERESSATWWSLTTVLSAWRARTGPPTCPVTDGAPFCGMSRRTALPRLA